MNSNPLREDRCAFISEIMPQVIKSCDPGATYLKGERQTYLQRTALVQEAICGWPPA